MKVEAIVSFVGRDRAGDKYRIEQGQEFEMPAGVDWLDRGLVKAIEPRAEAKAEAKGKKK